jgi:hypothetical protein
VFGVNLWEPQSDLCSWYGSGLMIDTEANNMGRGILLWLLGVPIPLIILVLLFFHH